MTVRISIELNEREMAALNQLVEFTELSVQRVMINALRLYQADTFPVELPPKFNPAESGGKDGE